MDVDELLGSMKLEEKCAHLGGVWYTQLLVEGQLDEGLMEQHLADGIGQVARIASIGFDPVPTAEAIDRIQRFLEERTRLGIPALSHEEALAGVMGPGATSFPQAIGLASTWDPELVEEIGEAIGRQLHAIGARLALSPVLDVARDPRWGRLEERIADMLAGDVDAGGRLPVSLLHHVGQVGAYPGHHHGGGRSLMYGDYTDGPVAPLFPFGHGLSYTTWTYDDVGVTAGSTTDDLHLEVTLTNTGDRDGEEVVQVYARDEVASVGRPAELLVAFGRTAAAPGETVRVRFTIPATALGFHGTDLRFRVEPGDVTFLVGPTETTVTMTGDVVHPDPNAARPFTATVVPR